MDTGVEGVALLTIFVLSAFTGYEVISKVSTVLHTPLLSGANAIHGVILIGAILVAGTAEGAFELAIALLAVTLATVNLVGGFVVTDRMLQMFGRGRPALAGGGPAGGPARKSAGGSAGGAGTSGRTSGSKSASPAGGKPAKKQAEPSRQPPKRTEPPNQGTSNDRSAGQPGDEQQGANQDG